METIEKFVLLQEENNTCYYVQLSNGICYLIQGLFSSQGAELRLFLENSENKRFPTDWETVQKYIPADWEIQTIPESEFENAEKEQRKKEENWERDPWFTNDPPFYDDLENEDEY